MNHHLATLGLGPILLVQGHYVRRVTPRLPEPDGERHGVVGEGSPLRLLIVGDSAAAGVGAATQAEALSGRLIAALAPHFRVSWKLIAKTGATTQDALNDLGEIPPETFDIAVTSLGVNDVTGRTGIRKWLARQAELVELLERRFEVRRTILSGLPPMQVFPALPQPLRWYLGAQAACFNTALENWTRSQRNVEFVPIEYPDDPLLIASDGFHPGPGAYAVWAARLAERIRQRT